MCYIHIYKDKIQFPQYYTYGSFTPPHQEGKQDFARVGSHQPRIEDSHDNKTPSEQNKLPF